jgi:type II restriction enzyme
LQPLEKIEYQSRGWTLDVLNFVRALRKQEFSLAEVYDASGELQQLHPNNLHVREKIRQQLQRLRDMGLLAFLGHGKYLLKP